MSHPVPNLVSLFDGNLKAIANRTKFEKPLESTVSAAMTLYFFSMTVVNQSTTNFIM